MSTLPPHGRATKTPPVPATFTGHLRTEQRIRQTGVLPRTGHRVDGLGLVQCVGGSDVAARVGIGDSNAERMVPTARRIHRQEPAGRQRFFGRAARAVVPAEVATTAQGVRADIYGKSLMSFVFVVICL